MPKANISCAVVLFGTPSVEIDLSTGRSVAGGPVELRAASLEVLRVLASGRLCRRHDLEVALAGRACGVDEAVAALVADLGPSGHHVERVGRHAWRLWQGPE